MFMALLGHGNKGLGKQQMYILRAYDQAGDIGYYSGKAGSEWVNNQITNAFGYESLDVALRKMASFNKFQPLHKMMFRVENLADELSAQKKT